MPVYLSSSKSRASIPIPPFPTGRVVSVGFGSGVPTAMTFVINTDAGDDKKRPDPNVNLKKR